MDSEKLKEYLKENLKIEMTHERFLDNTIKITLKLEDEIISETSMSGDSIIDAHESIKGYFG